MTISVDLGNPTRYTQSMDVKLKPCPFCRCANIIKHDAAAGTFIICRDCRSQVFDQCAGKVVARWNDGTIPRPDDFERMRRQLWVDILVKATDGDNTLGKAVLAADRVVEAFDNKFKVES